MAAGIHSARYSVAMAKPPIRVLLIQGRSARTYWGFQYCLPLAGLRAAHPPLGLITVAAMLPGNWQLRLVDLQVEELTARDLAWAEVALISGMLAHAPSMRAAIAQSRAGGVRTIVGGPAATSCPEAFADADHIFRGEAEGRLAALIETIETGDAAPRELSPALSRPDIEEAPVPRYDLLAPGAYASLSLQYSRGCPFDCEFCDIVSLFGRRPRVKSPAQILAELDVIAATGYRGSVFFVDDNFIGNRRAVAELLPHLAAWQAAHGHPFDLYTEASVDLAGRPDLMAAMTAAGFTAVFVGIETPSVAGLREAGKKHNLKQDLAEAVLDITRAGLEVHAGFIVGFDSDGPDIFRLQRDFIASLPIPLAMVGMLTALPGTRLHTRLAAAGRLRHVSGGDQFARPNFEPAMDEAYLLSGYRWLLSSLYQPAAYFARCRALLDTLGPTYQSAAVRRGGLRIAARTTAHLGVASPHTRRHYWPLLARAARRPALLPRAVSLALMGQHLCRYTRDDVVPALDLAITTLQPPIRPAAAAVAALVP